MFVSISISNLVTERMADGGNHLFINTSPSVYAVLKISREIISLVKHFNNFRITKKKTIKKLFFLLLDVKCVLSSS